MFFITVMYLNNKRRDEMSVMRTFTFIISIFIVGMVEMMVAGILNLMSDDLHVSAAVVGQLVTVYALTFAICGPILVKLTRQYTSRSVLLWSIVFFIVGNAVIALAPNFTILLIGRVVSSAAAALIVVKILALTAQLTPAKHRGKMLGVVYTGFSGANVFGVPIGTVIGDLVGWRFTFWFIVAVGFVTGALLIKYLPTQAELDARQVHELQSTTSRIKQPFEVAKLLTITFLLLVANSVTYIFINPIITEGGHNLSYLSVALLVIGIAGVIGTSMGGVLTDKLSSKTWLMISSVIFMATLFILESVVHTSIVLIVVLFVWHLAQWSTNPAVQAGLIQQVEGDTSQVMSWNMSSLNAGIGIGGIIGGLVVARADVYMTLYVSGAIVIVTLFVIMALKRTSRVHSEQ